MLPLLVFVFWIGVYPNTFFDKMNPALEQALTQMGHKPAIVEVYNPAAAPKAHAQESQGHAPAAAGHH